MLHASLTRRAHGWGGRELSEKGKPCVFSSSRTIRARTSANSPALKLCRKSEAMRSTVGAELATGRLQQ
jgi:hypothetical protein